AAVAGAAAAGDAAAGAGAAAGAAGAGAGRLRPGYSLARRLPHTPTGATRMVTATATRTATAGFGLVAPPAAARWRAGARVGGGARGAAGPKPAAGMQNPAWALFRWSGFLAPLQRLRRSRQAWCASFLSSVSSSAMKR